MNPSQFLKHLNKRFIDLSPGKISDSINYVGINTKNGGLSDNDRSLYPGFEFVSSGISYLLRFVDSKKVNNRNDIVIETKDPNNIIVNFRVDTNTLEIDNERLLLKENFRISKVEKQTAKNAMSTAGFKGDVIFDINLNDYKINDVITKLFSWIEKRESARTIIKNYQNVKYNPQDPEEDIPIELNIKMNSLNQILFGPPGTGKTYNTINKALELLNDDVSGKTRGEIKKLYEQRVNEGQIVFTTFHQNMSYEDFIEGIKPKLDDKNLGYDIIPGIFKTICDSANSDGDNFNEKIEWLKSQSSEAENNPPVSIKYRDSEFSITYREGKTFRIKPKNSKNPESDYPASIANIRKLYEGGSRNEVYNPTYVNGILNYLKDNGLSAFSSNKNFAKPYVLIIDEINRGNVSQIFGELITLIEEDKRLGKDEALEVILPYSKEKFGVPPNVYIIGTMNTADRSVEALDTALRRRFDFVEMPPKPEVITIEGKLKEQNGILNDIDLAHLLTTINGRIEILLDRDHLIGHSYFMHVASLYDLKVAFHNKIVPLLQEYFYGDYGKIGLILGEDFFEIINENKNTKLTNFPYPEGDVFSDIIIYKLKNIAQMDDNTFINAVSKMMN